METSSSMFTSQSVRAELSSSESLSRGVVLVNVPNPSSVGADLGLVLLLSSSLAASLAVGIVNMLSGGSMRTAEVTIDLNEYVRHKSTARLQIEQILENLML